MKSFKKIISLFLKSLKKCTIFIAKNKTKSFNNFLHKKMLSINSNNFALFLNNICKILEMLIKIIFNNKIQLWF